MSDYVSLSREAYDNVIRAAGSRAYHVAKVFNDQGVWDASADDDAPPNAVVNDKQTELL